MSKNTLSLLFFIIVFSAFFIRILLGFAQVYVSPLPDSGADAVFFEERAWQIVELWKDAKPIPGPSGRDYMFYPTIVAVFYYLFGRHPIIAISLNVLLGCLTLIVMYFITYEVFENKNAAILAVFIGTLFPTMNLYSVVILREYCFILPLSLSVYTLLRAMKNGKVSLFILSLSLLIIASFFHVGLILFYILYILLYLIQIIHRRKNMRNVGIVLLILVVLSFLLFYIHPFIDSTIPAKVAALWDPKFYSTHVAIAARDRTAYLIGLVPDSPYDLVWQTPIRIVYFIFSPFIWMVNRFDDLLGLVDGILYFILIFFGVTGIKGIYQKNRMQAWSIGLIILVFLLTFSWGASNYGTAIRHRHKIVWLLIVCASGGIQIWFQNVLNVNYIHRKHQNERNQGQPHLLSPDFEK